MFSCQGLINQHKLNYITSAIFEISTHHLHNTMALVYHNKCMEPLTKNVLPVGYSWNHGEDFSFLLGISSLFFGYWISGLKALVKVNLSFWIIFGLMLSQRSKFLFHFLLSEGGVWGLLAFRHHGTPKQWDNIWSWKDDMEHRAMVLTQNLQNCCGFDASANKNTPNRLCI